MAWISQVRVGDSRTSFKDGGNGKCEREMTVSFAPGEVKTEDTKTIQKYMREMGELVKCEIDLVLGNASEVRAPPKGKADENKDPPVKATEKQLKYLAKLAGHRLMEVLDHYGVKDLEALTVEQASEAISNLKGAMK